MANGNENQVKQQRAFLERIGQRGLSRKIGQRFEEKKKSEFERFGRGRELTDRLRGQLLDRQRTEFDEARRQAQQQIGRRVGQELGTARRNLTQALGQRGFAGPGGAQPLEQQAQIQLAAAGAQQIAQDIGQFETNLQLAQQQERAAFARGEFNFLSNLVNLSARADIEREMLRFQAQVAADRQSAGFFNDLLGSAAQLVGGPLIGAIGGAIGNQRGQNLARNFGPGPVL